MKIDPSSKSINPWPCTPEDHHQNWTSQAEINNTFIEVINTGGTTDTFKVKVHGGAGETADFLHNKLTNVGASNEETSVKVRGEVSGNKEYLFWDAADVRGYGGSANGMVLTLAGDASEMLWAEAPLFTDTLMVKTSSSDSTAEFLYDSMIHKATYVSTADMPVMAQDEDVGGGNRRLRLFVDASALPGWSDTGLFVYVLNSNTSQLMSASSLASVIYQEGDLIDISGTIISVDLTEAPSHSLGAMQLLVHFSGAAPQWVTAENYDTSDKRRFLVHEMGVWKWYGDVAKIGRAASGIPARSGTTPGSGTVRVWRLNAGTLENTGVDETWYNISDRPISPNKYLMAKMVDGQMVVDFEEC